MRIHDPKLRNMAQALSLSVFIAFKGTNFYIFICLFQILLGHFLPNLYVSFLVQGYENLVK